MAGVRYSRRELGRLAVGLAAASTAELASPSLLTPAYAAALREPLRQTAAKLVPFASAPFPYDGTRPDDGTDFLDTTGADGRVGHVAPRGGVYYADQTYSDNRVLVALPAGFDARRRAAIVVFFHGNSATLQRDVIGRQRVLDQLQSSHLNAALLAPQFAVDALDSSAGRFWQRGAFSRFMAEAAVALARLAGSRDAQHFFASLPIILVAYSGGYNPAAYALAVGGVGRRIRGVILLDALVGETGKFFAWIAASHRSGFFFSAYSQAAADGNTALERQLTANGISFSTALPRALAPGGITFLETAGADHDDYVTQAWVKDPLTWLFDRLPGLAR
jgi:hypothetical protein